MKVMPSGATIKGTLQQNKLNGYGVMTWATGAAYAGDWVNDQRSGWGIYRTPKGTEYVVGWLNGKRDGFGCFMNSIGEEYVGNGVTASCTVWVGYKVPTATTTGRVQAPQVPRGGYIYQS